MSKLELDNIIPVKPPKVKRKIKPFAHKSGIAEEFCTFEP